MAPIAALWTTALLCFAQLAFAVTIPEPDPSTHKYAVAAASFSVISTIRIPMENITLNGGEIDPRGLMVSVFLPVPPSVCTKYCEDPYMPPKTARTCNAQFFGDENAGVFDAMTVKLCCAAVKRVEVKDFPVAVIEPQLGVSRLLYSTLAKHVSANGVVVVLIDRAGDSSIVEYPHGLTAYTNYASPKNLSPFKDIKAWNSTTGDIISTRMIDIGFVLEYIAPYWRMHKHFSDFEITQDLNISEYSVIGHGIGGTVATLLGVMDPRVRFTINMSGGAPLLMSESAATTYFFGRSDFRRENDFNWNSTWAQLTGRATEWDLQDASIFDFSDIPQVVDLAKPNININTAGKGLSASTPNGYKITSCFVEAYVNYELLNRTSDLAECAKGFPQMVPYPGVYGKKE